MESLQNDNSVFNDKHLYSVKSLPEHKKHLTPVMNNVSFAQLVMVDIVFVVLDKDIEGHPMHLHGHSFYLLAMKENDKAESLDDMEELDRQGLLPRKLINPIVKDTIKIPPDYYAILRFRADNSVTGGSRQFPENRDMFNSIGHALNTGRCTSGDKPVFIFREVMANTIGILTEKDKDTYKDYDAGSPFARESREREREREREKKKKKKKKKKL
nr:hypothetical protein BaRGS_023565 [Batillaria attramentaria]